MDICQVLLWVDHHSSNPEAFVLRNSCQNAYEETSKPPRFSVSSSLTCACFGFLMLRILHEFVLSNNVTTYLVSVCLVQLLYYAKSVCSKAAHNSFCISLSSKVIFNFFYLNSKHTLK